MNSSRASFCIYTISEGEDIDTCFVNDHVLFQELLVQR